MAASISKIVVISDTHYGLKSAGFDRIEEIHNVTSEVVEYAISNGADFFVHCGDIGHRALPDPRIHSMWVELYSRLEECRVFSEFLLGNHDIVHDRNKPYGNLAPLDVLGNNYVVAVNDYSFFSHIDNLYFMFLPYFNQAYVGEKHNEYYERKVNESLSQLSPQDVVIAFTHLNIEHATIGDDYILRPVNATIPQQLYDSDNVKLIVSGHIHKSQEIGEKQVVIGSPIYTDFGDHGEKRFLEIDIRDDLGIDVKSIPTSCVNLHTLEFDLTNGDQLDIDWSEIEGCGLKVKIRATKDQIESINIPEFENKLRKYCRFVQPIVPTVVKMETEKKSIIKSGMTDKDLVEKWIEVKRPDNYNGILKTALEVIEQ